jgi:alpha-L-fucosidase 2
MRSAVQAQSLGFSILFSVGFFPCYGQRGPDIAAKYTIVMTEPPKLVPSGTVVDGPILGNGDLGVAIAGPPEEQQFYFGKNDFWSQQESLLSVGGLSIRIPELAGATYRQEQDLAHAEVRGTFAKPGLAVRMRSWVSATEDLSVTELNAEGSSVHVTASLFPPGAAIRNNDKPVNLGREQHQSGRWYFDGLLDEVRIFNRALQPAEIQDLSHATEVEQGLVRRWTFEKQEGSTPVDTPAKLVTAPACSLPPLVYRPSENPTDEPNACRPDGYHLDYQRFSVGKFGRALKVMHSSAYIDAGQAPALQQVTVAAWIYIFKAGDANFILSKGEWNDAYSLSLDHGRLRFNIGDVFARTAGALPVQKWIHVAGSFDGSVIRTYVDGEESLPRARFLTRGESSNMLWMSRNADGPADEQYAWSNPLPAARGVATKGREITVVTRLVGAQGTIRDRELDFTLQPGDKVYLVSPVRSDLDAPDHRAAAITRAQELGLPGLDNLNAAHRDWWKHYWSESSVEINDPLLEKFYYSSQYLIASASHSGRTAPGLYGPWVTTDHPSWNGDYTTNYNHQTPFLALYSSNHISTTDPYDPPVLEFVERAKLYAQTLLNVRGVYYPGHMGPWGMERPFDYEPFMGQKSDAAFLAQPMFMRFYSTYDLTYTQLVYPFIREVGNFWEDYLKFEGGRYVIHDDCPGEAGPWSAPGNGSSDWTACRASMNPTNDLAFVRATFRGLVAMSTELGVDAERRAKWQQIVDKLSAFPTEEKNGKIVFRSSESGAGHGGGGMRAVWPTGEIGLGSDPKLLQIARNSADEIPNNNHPLTAPALARVGYDPAKLLDNMRTAVEKNAYPNGYIFFYGGGVETASSIPGAINEMLLQSHEGVIRLFPVWPKDRDARFEHLRAYGAFLISSDWTQSQVRSLTIESEKGKLCRLENPWPGRSLVLFRNGREAEVLKGQQVTFPTSPGEQISISVQPH